MTEAPKTPEEKLDRAKRNLKVMEMQDTLNEGLKESFRARIAFGGVRRYIPEFCEFVIQNPEFERFKNLTLEDLIIAWHDVAPMKTVQLKEAIIRVKAEIKKLDTVSNETKSQ